MSAYIDPNSHASINAAVAAAANKTVIIYDTQTLASNLTVPANVGLMFINGGKIAKASSYSLTINGPLTADAFQIFSGFNAGDVKEGTASGAHRTMEVLPEWWGAVGDGSTNDYTAINSALSYFDTDKEGILRFGAKQYNYGTTIALANYQVLQGSGIKSTKLHYTGNSIAVSIIGTGGGPWKVFTAVSNLTIEAHNGGNATHLLYIASAHKYIKIENVHLLGGAEGPIYYNTGDCLHIDESWNMIFDNVQAELCGNDGIELEATIGTAAVNENLFLNCTGKGNGDDGLALTNTAGTQMQNNIFINNDFTLNAGDGIELNGNVQQNNFIDTWSERNGGHGLYMHGGTVHFNTFSHTISAWNSGKSLYMKDDSSLNKFLQGVFGDVIIEAGASNNIFDNTYFDGTIGHNGTNAYGIETTITLQYGTQGAILAKHPSTWTGYTDRGGSFVGGVLTFTSTTIDPDMHGINTLIMQPTASYNLDSFWEGIQGQVVTVIFNNSNTTVDFTASQLHGNSGVNWSPQQYDSMICTCLTGASNNTSVWVCDISDNTGW